MPISFPCSGCGATLKVGDEFAGKKCKCPHCKAINTVAAGAVAVEAPRKAKEADSATASTKAKAKAPAVEAEEPAGDTKGKKGQKVKAKKSSKGMLILGGAAVLLVGLFSCTYCGVGTGVYFWFPEWVPLALGGTPSELKYMPTGTTQITFERVDQEHNSKVGKAIEAAIPSNMNSGDADDGPYGISTSNIDCRLSGGTATEHVTVITSKSSVKKEDIESKMKAKGGNVEFEDEKAGSYTIRKRKSGGNSFCVVGSKTVVYSADPKILKAVLERDKMPEWSSGFETAMKRASFSKTQVSINAGSAGKEFAGKKSPEWSIHEVDAGSDLKQREIAEYKDKDAAATAKKDADDRILRDKGELEKKGVAGEAQFSVSVSGSTVIIERRITSKGITEMMKR